MDQVTDYIQKVEAPAQLWPQFKENLNLAKDYCRVASKARDGKTRTHIRRFHGLVDARAEE